MTKLTMLEPAFYDGYESAGRSREAKYEFLKEKTNLEFSLLPEKFNMDAVIKYFNAIHVERDLDYEIKTPVKIKWTMSDTFPYWRQGNKMEALRPTRIMALLHGHAIQQRDQVAHKTYLQRRQEQRTPYHIGDTDVEITPDKLVIVSQGSHIRVSDGKVLNQVKVVNPNKKEIDALKSDLTNAIKKQDALQAEIHDIQKRLQKLED